MDQTGIIKQTTVFKYGNWIAKGKTNDGKNVIVEIEIQTNKVSVTKTFSDMVNKDEFDGDIWWVEQFCQFLNERKYFFTYADKEILKFGEMSNPAVFDGNYIWFLNFQRV
jgi:hypothetical protein